MSDAPDIVADILSDLLNNARTHAHTAIPTALKIGRKLGKVDRNRIESISSEIDDLLKEFTRRIIGYLLSMRSASLVHNRYYNSLLRGEIGISRKI